ncbi:hypothetical protein [Paracoccus lutimaris]|uniref:Uncharacterized protein n=1 Tax=Paracoccus lutimaris TaxID=1490030 RepID=A0A368YRL8_9RHOB|nr:hypothetical protein [Paracoccus lutimaris]RCW82872.1 hypothetical protein DFP89_11176 [Paracoccus lutimaris]
MSRKTDGLGKLERVARLKSDLEMRRFSAFRAHLIAARERVEHLGDELEAVYRSDSPFSVAEARLTNALAGEKSRALMRAEAELAQMMPGFEIARRGAVRAFGRAEVLRDLREESHDADSQARERRLAGDAVDLSRCSGSAAVTGGGDWPHLPGPDSPA